MSWKFQAGCTHSMLRSGVVTVKLEVVGMGSAHKARKAHKAKKAKKA